MEQHASWTETVRDIFLSPLQCCLTSGSPDEAENHSLTEGSMTVMPIPLTTEITETTQLLDQPYYQCYGPSQPGLEQEKNQSYKPFTTDAPNIVAAPRPVSAFSFQLFEEFDKWDGKEGVDTDATDDQDNQTDPFEYDNAPEYRDILGHKVTTAPAPDLKALPTIELEEVGLTRDLIKLRRMLELGLRPRRTDDIEMVENTPPKIQC
ncbi:hypothetical protein L211DRAFT_871307 [Terfezia boudieri ATCC MYA-4762]|uniref:Uncharacterized protein n=1 Tax=Terfezia boudieri ATCC MYA-4762 TaxID=1051890 RepID=A0A3N4L961_9PEZI|nr:hypothetical protein L211DRAFT_871307 [Terfezia boudieri ATCC MYA-4762]